MNLQPGSTVVHPHHGPATVVGRFARTVRGESVEYVDLAVHGGTLKVSVPAARADEISIRDLPDSGELHRFAEVLCGPSTPEESQWSRRIKAQRELLISGDPVKLAGLVRDLLRRGERSPLGTAEKDLLRQASGPLMAEVALSVGCDEESAYEVTRRLALGESADVLATLPEPACA